ncbi:MAG: DNA mismatch endonuclease Vsr, partial [Gammaproteobacteria bacterium]|nr:DNA mismatch endonuclease Vsr [Gammaproteobacteria bacterium]
ENTAPEIAVRKYLYARGIRYRIHDRKLPGSPDVVVPSSKSVVFINGCFWHGHDCKHGLIKAKKNRRFWATKIVANQKRDRRKTRELKQLGWHVEVVWECETSHVSRLQALARSISNLRNR